MIGSSLRSGAAALVFCAATPAVAGDLFKTEPAASGFYVSGFAGATFYQDSSFNGISAPEAGVPGPTGVAGVPLDVDLTIGNGLTFGGAVGYQLPFRYLRIFHPRLEIEGSVIKREIDAGSFNGGTQTFLGDQNITFVYLNNHSDIVFSENQRFVPYVGGGIGVAFTDSNVGYFPASASAPTFAVTGNGTHFTTHGALGASYRISANLEAYAEGRYFRIYGVKFDRRFVDGGADLFVGEVEDTIDGLSATAGLRWRF